MNPRPRQWTAMLLATAWAQALLIAGFMLLFETYAHHSQAFIFALFGMGAMVAMVLVIDRCVTDALPAVVIGLKLSALLAFCGGGAWAVYGVLVSHVNT